MVSRVQFGQEKILTAKLGLPGIVRCRSVEGDQDIAALMVFWYRNGNNIARRIPPGALRVAREDREAGVTFSSKSWRCRVSQHNPACSSPKNTQAAMRCEALGRLAISNP